MNTNVGDMPLDIFSDYVSDIIGEDFLWLYFIIMAAHNFSLVKQTGFGIGYGASDLQARALGFGRDHNNGLVPYIGEALVECYGDGTTMHNYGYSGSGGNLL